jgi:hypothetical protein
MVSIDGEQRSDSLIKLRARELRGSRLRCLMLTSMPQEQVRSILARLVAPLPSVTIGEIYSPCGFLRPEEPKLGEYPDFLTQDERDIVTDWWLKVRRNANTPNWDIVSKCDIGGKRGLILVEAKAHSGESKREGKSRGNADNDSQIDGAIREANVALNSVLPGWALTKDSHYQLCNRFAWAWKLGAIGIPTILVYLGFLNCDEMCDCGMPFTSAQEWDGAVRQYADGIVPPNAWGVRVATSSAPIWAVIRSLDLQWQVS